MPAPSTVAVRRRRGSETTDLLTKEVVPARPTATIVDKPPCPERLAAQRRQAQAELAAIIIRPMGGGIVSGGSASSRSGKRRIGC